MDSIAVQVPRSLSDLEQNRSRRWIMITGLLEAGLTLTAEQLTRRFSISLRTAYRDIQEIQAMGFPILCDKGRYSLNYKLWDSWIRYQYEAWEVKTKQTNE